MRVQDKLSQLHVPHSTCKWITDFVSDSKQHVKLGKHVSASRTITTGSPKDALFPLCSSPCTQTDAPPVTYSVKLLKFADDTTLIGLISGGVESAYRWQSEHLVTWCSQNNQELNALKTVEMVVDFRKNGVPPSPIPLCDSRVTTVDCFHFLGFIITQDLKWELNISSITKKAQHRMFFPEAAEEIQPAKHGYHSVFSLLLLLVWLQPQPRTRAGCSVSSALQRG
ncbi:uncharacterized protein AB9W97_007377 isoform 1-T2 [Spinachia spinachia]